MAISSYQLERLLEHLRRAGRWLAWPADRRWRGADPVRVSPAAQAARQAQDGPAAPPYPEARRVASVRDDHRLDPLVEAERERRAGSFMDPPFPDAPAPSHIPKLARDADWRAARRAARPVTDGD